MTLVVGQFMAVILPPSNDETEVLAYPDNHELVEGEAPVDDGIVLGGAEFTVSGANRFCHANWLPIRQYIFDLSICDNVTEVVNELAEVPELALEAAPEVIAGQPAEEVVVNEEAVDLFGMFGGEEDEDDGRINFIVVAAHNQQKQLK